MNVFEVNIVPVSFFSEQEHHLVPSINMAKALAELAFWRGIGGRGDDFDGQLIWDNFCLTVNNKTVLKLEIKVYSIGGPSVAITNEEDLDSSITNNQVLEMMRMLYEAEPDPGEPFPKMPWGKFKSLSLPHMLEERYNMAYKVLKHAQAILKNM